MCSSEWHNNSRIQSCRTTSCLCDGLLLTEKNARTEVFLKIRPDFTVVSSKTIFFLFETKSFQIKDVVLFYLAMHRILSVKLHKSIDETQICAFS